MVAEHGAAHHRAHTTEQDRVMFASGKADARAHRYGQGDDDRKQDGHGSPARAGGEGRCRGDEKDEAGQERQWQRFAEEPGKEIARSDGLGRFAQTPGHDQYENRHQHGLHAADQGFDGLLHRQDALEDDQPDGDHASGEGSPDQRQEGIRIADNGHQTRFVGAFVVEAGNRQSDQRHDHDRDHGYQCVVPPMGFALDRLQRGGIHIGGGYRARSHHPSAGDGATLGFQHGTEIAFHQDHHEHEGQSQKRIEQIGQRMQEDGEGVVRAGLQLRGQDGIGRLFSQIGERIPDLCDFEADPCGQHGAYGQGCGRRVDDIRQFLAGDEQTVGHGPQRIAADQRVRVIIEEDDEGRKCGEQLPLSTVARQAAEGVHHAACAAALRHDADHAAQQQAEDDDGHMLAVGCHLHDELQ